MSALWVVPEELEDAAESPYAYEACKAASYVLWAFSGRKYSGVRTVTERYECPCTSSQPLNVYPYTNGDGIVRNRISDAGDCGCGGTVFGRHVRLRLRGTPVRSVQQVVKDGNELDPSQYKIINGSLLQVSGALDICGLQVTYTYGTPAPTAGRRAARSLASELVKGWSGSDDCMLPDRITNVNRQGLSFTVMDPQDFLDDGRTGIYEVDLFLRAANPDKARKPARVFSPDLPKASRVTAGMAQQVANPSDWMITPGQGSTWSLDLVSNNAEILDQNDWNPQGQITSWNGATLLEFDSSRFNIVGGVLTVTLLPSETASIQGSTAAWDLYGINALDGYTLIHVHSSTIRTTGVS